MPAAIDFVKRIFGRGSEPKPKPLSRSVIEHDSLDEMVWGNYADDSARFRRITIEEAPHVPPKVTHPDPIDFTQATPEEIVDWQKAERAARAAENNAPPYEGWRDLTRDVFYSYHHVRQPTMADPTNVDPGVQLHQKIIQKLIVQDDHAHTRNETRDNPTLAAWATMYGAGELRDVLSNELCEQAQQAEEFEDERDRAEAYESALEGLREQARELHGQGQPVPRDLVDAIKDAVQSKRQAQQRAAEIAANPIPFSHAAQKRIEEIATRAYEAAQQAAGMPSFGQGFGDGEPVYESPEHALSIAEMWAENTKLRAMAALFGRLKLDMDAQRAKRVIGGQDEIVDLKFGDELRRVAASELGLLADDDFEDDFYARYLAGELLVYETVGEERADMGPIGLVVDGSGSMAGERTIWSRAVAMCLLNIARKEKRDFFMIEFSSATQQAMWTFPAKAPLDAQQIVNMCSHSFGGGTQPLAAVEMAVKYMDDVPEFKKADLCIISDGEAAFNNDDKRYRDHLREKGVRIFGIGIGRSFGYLKKMCLDGLVHIHDFDLQNPSEATTMLATHLS